MMFESINLSDLGQTMTLASGTHVAIYSVSFQFINFNSNSVFSFYNVLYMYLSFSHKKSIREQS